MSYDPFLSTNPIVTALTQHRGRIEQVRENTARTAESYATFVTQGLGQFVLADAAIFGCTFIDRPAVAYGCSLSEDADGSDVLTPIEGNVPRGSGLVVKWIKDANNYYTGAYVVLVIDAPDAPVQEAGSTTTPVIEPISAPSYVLEHDFTFTGIAIKDVPESLLAATVQGSIVDTVVDT